MGLREGLKTGISKTEGGGGLVRFAKISTFYYHVIFEGFLRNILIKNPISRDRGQMVYFREFFQTHVAPTKFYVN